MQHGNAVIEVHSARDIKDFYTAVEVSNNIIDLTIILLWEATETELHEVLEEAESRQVVFLRLEGVGFKDHAIYTTAQECVYVRNIVSSNKLIFVSFANVSEQVKRFTTTEYAVFHQDKRIVSTGLPVRPSEEWNRFRRFVVEFQKAAGFPTNSVIESDATDRDGIEYGARNDNSSCLSTSDEIKDEDIGHKNTMDKSQGDNSTDAKSTLRDLVLAHPFIHSVTYMTATHLAARFDMHGCVFHCLTGCQVPGGVC